MKNSIYMIVKEIKSLFRRVTRLILIVLSKDKLLLIKSFAARAMDDCTRQMISRAGALPLPMHGRRVNSYNFPKAGDIIVL